jgi:ABC-type oligopeptide transport system substrate-binding subunit
MNRFNVFFVLGIWLLVILFVLNGCSEPGDQTASSQRSATESPVSGGTYRIPLRSNPATLDPARIKDQYGTAVVRQVFEGLVRFDAYLTVLPSLARTWQVEEGDTSTGLNCGTMPGFTTETLLRRRMWCFLSPGCYGWTRLRRCCLIC